MRVINDRLHEDVRLPNTTVCPYCGCKMNTATSADLEAIQHGDYGVCVGCAEVCISVISKDGRHALRKATEADIEYAKQTTMYTLLLQYQEMIRNQNHGLKVKR